MEYLKKNPKVLVDALPEPDSCNKTMYHPVYDQILDQENNYRNSNVHNSQDTKIYGDYDRDALTLNARNRESFEGAGDHNNIQIITNEQNRSSMMTQQNGKSSEIKRIL
jgi:hypothetical protein